VGQNRQRMQRRTVFLTALATTVALGALAVLAFATVVLAGLYDVASTRQHWQVTHTVMETAMRQAVRLRARDVREPPLADGARVLRGAGCFRDHCVQCHGAPGVAQGGIGQSMQPLPGPLVDAHRHWRARELYWLTRHGIKMSGMPAWEYRLAEDELWDVVAFLVKLPELDAAAYADLARRAPAPACGRSGDVAAPGTGADLDRGRQALHQYACSSCHIIPGVTGSSPHVGPPLEGIGSRALIAGTLANTQENRERWILFTQQVKPGTAMPQLGVAPRDARDIAAYLGTLK
jgi:mono/diheme cytochrome c family protein